LVEEDVQRLTTLPTWVAVVLGLAPIIIAVVAIVAESLRERGRRGHERAMRVREERMQAYSTMTRLTKVIEPTPARTVPELVEALAEIELLTDDPQLFDTAGKLVAKAGHTSIAARRFRDNEITREEVDNTQKELTECRKEFVRLAKRELAQ
jgi:hypothetical protein